MSASVDTIRELAQQEYKWGFVTEIDEDRVPKGLNEGIVRLISERKGEPELMLDWRLKALRHWMSMEREEGEPKWANVKFTPSTTRTSSTTRRPSRRPQLDKLDDIDPEILPHLREARHSAGRAEAAGRRGRGRGVRQRVRGDDVQGQAGGDGRDLLLVL